MLDETPVRALAPHRTEPELEAAGDEQALERVGPRHLLTSLDAGDRRLRDAGPARQFPL